MLIYIIVFEIWLEIRYALKFNLLASNRKSRFAYFVCVLTSIETDLRSSPKRLENPSASFPFGVIESRKQMCFQRKLQLVTSANDDAEKVLPISRRKRDRKTAALFKLSVNFSHQNNLIWWKGETKIVILSFFNFNRKFVDTWHSHRKKNFKRGYKALKLFLPASHTIPLSERNCLEFLAVSPVCYAVEMTVSWSWEQI